MVQEIANFYGVYLLFSTHPKYHGWTYIGFTVNPNRRIQQHNKGRQAGGARRTHNRGPWDMTLIVHGFPNMISALRFEWAWTKPQISRRLKHVAKKKKSETKFSYCIRVMCEMLRTGPWNRLPLTIRWLKQQYIIDFDPLRLPPTHMPIEYGPVVDAKKRSKRKAECNVDTERATTETTNNQQCHICSSKLNTDSSTLICFNCGVTSHTICVARHFLSSSSSSSTCSTSSTTTFLLPIDGSCPSCRVHILWGDLIKYKHGCYQSDRTDVAETLRLPNIQQTDVSSF